MRLMVHAAVWATGCGAVCAAATAGPIQAQHVPQDATWIAHIDLEAMKSSELFRSIADLDAAFEEIDREFSREFGFEITSDFAGITAFGSGGPDEFDGAILYGSAEINKILGVVQEHFPDHTRTIGGGVMAYTWQIEDEDAHLSLRVNVAQSRIDADDRAVSPWTLLVAPHEGGLASLGEVVANGRGGSALAAGAANAPVIFFSTDELGDVLGRHGHGEGEGLMNNAHSRMLAAARTLSVAIGERDEQFYIDADLVSTDDESANDITATLNGLLAMARFAAAGDEEGAEMLALIQDLSVTADGHVVELRLRADTAGIVEFITTNTHGTNGTINLHIGDDEYADGDEQEIRIHREVQIGDDDGDGDH